MTSRLDDDAYGCYLFLDLRGQELLLLILITSVDHNGLMIVCWCQSHKLWLVINTDVVVPHL